MPKQEEWQRLEALAPIIDAAAGDPIFPALRDWQDARRAELEAMDIYGELERQHGPNADEARRHEVDHVVPAQDDLIAAYAKISRTVPTTRAGLAAQLAVVVNSEDAEKGAQHGWPEETILVSMRDAAVRLAQAS